MDNFNRVTIWERNGWKLEKGGSVYHLLHNDNCRLLISSEAYSLLELSLVQLDGFTEIRSLGKAIMRVVDN